MPGPVHPLGQRDGVQLSSAVDQDGQQYIALLTGDQRHPGAYLVATMEPGDLQAFRNGETDMRSLLEHASQLSIILLTEPLEQSGLLPGVGYFLGSGADPEDSGRNAPESP